MPCVLISLSGKRKRQFLPRLHLYGIEHLERALYRNFGLVGVEAAGGQELVAVAPPYHRLHQGIVALANFRNGFVSILICPQMILLEKSICNSTATALTGLGTWRLNLFASFLTVSYFTRTFLPLMIFNPCLGALSFLPLKS